MAVYPLDPLRDLRHRQARSAPDVAAWLTWLHLGGKAPGTLEQYEWTLAALLRAYPATPVDEFTDLELGAFLIRFPEKSRSLRKAHLSSFFKWARLTRRIDANPMDLLPIFKRPSRAVVEVFNERERKALSALPLPDGPLMRLLLEAGLRKAEARNLTGKRIDFETAEIVVSEGAKGSRDRRVPMIPRLVAAMDELLTVEGIGRDDFLWYDRPGGGRSHRVRRSKPIGNDSYKRWWARCLDVAGVGYRRPHTTRHTYATWMKNECGSPMEDISANLGHSSIATTVDVYVHLSSADIGRRMREGLAARGL